MILLTPEQTATLREWFLPERPGPLVGQHIIHTGYGTCWADRWPDPRAILVETAGNYALAGDPRALEPADLKGRITGFVEASEPFVPLLLAAFPDAKRWDRVIFELRERPHVSLPRGYLIRRLDEADASHLQGLSPETAWIGKTWGGPTGLAASGRAWGAFAGTRLVSVACVFFVGAQYEEIGVATEPEFRGRGLSAACAGSLCEEIWRRGHWSSWSTSPDNVASIRVAEKLGFSRQRQDCLYVVGLPKPVPPGRQET
ncbi:MAG TPA: GNAT family N-acetyltransferase [Anaerolineae bacterium]